MKRLALSAFLAFSLVCSLMPLRAAATPALILTSSSPTACTSVSIGPGVLLGLLNASTSAQTVTISLYDESVPTCASADLVYAAQLGASQVITLPYFVSGSLYGPWLARGLAYKLSAAATNNIVVLYQ